MKKIGTLLASTFSFVLCPLLMPFYSIVMLFFYTTFGELYLNQVFRFLLPVLLLGTLVPALFVFVLKKLGIVADYTLSHSSDRIFPYLMVCFSNMALLYHFYSLNMYAWFLGVLAVPIVLSVVGFLANFFVKISTHMIGIGGLIGSILSVCYNIKGLNPFVFFIILFILAGYLGVSRLYLKRNSAVEVYAGFFVGFIFSFLTIWINVFVNYSR